MVLFGVVESVGFLVDVDGVEVLVVLGVVADVDGEGVVPVVVVTEVVVDGVVAKKK